MKNFLATAIAAAVVTLSFGHVAEAQNRDWKGPPRAHPVQKVQPKRLPPDRRWHGGPSARSWDAARHYQPARGNQRARRMSRNDYVYRGNDGRYYCRRSDGTTGLVVGGVLGGLIGSGVSGDMLGTLIGAAGGAALGHAIDRGQVNCR
ncbi:MAG: glycine zipper 2TM domain-containing protein [Burkholderiaceae bacterium]|jgi:hypothetical protein|nr:glycine zipper 2TM domain-containing protein [Burkholderiaceae bacterium]